MVARFLVTIAGIPYTCTPLYYLRPLPAWVCMSIRLPMFSSFTCKLCSLTCILPSAVIRVAVNRCVCVCAFVCLFVCLFFVCMFGCVCMSPSLPLSFTSASPLLLSLLFLSRFFGPVHLPSFYLSIIHLPPLVLFPFFSRRTFSLVSPLPLRPFPFPCPLYSFRLSFASSLFSIFPQFLPFPLISFSAPFLSVPVVFYLPLNFSRSP